MSGDGGSTVGAPLVLFAATATATAALLAGLPPALGSSSVNPAEELKAVGGARHRLRSRLRGSLVVLQVALVTVLLVSAGLLGRSFTELLAVEPGFAVRGVLTARLVLPPSRYGEPTRVVALFEELRKRIHSATGAEAVGASSSLPLCRDQFATGFQVGEGAGAGGEHDKVTEFRVVTPGYLEAMAIPLLRGREFDGRDTARSEPVVLVNEAFGRRFFPDGDPLGRTISPGFTTDGTDPPMRRIVGIVGDTTWRGFDRPSAPEAYVPHAQVPSFGDVPFRMALVVRSDVDSRRLAGVIDDQVRSLDPDLAVFDAQTFDEVVAAAVAEPRFYAVVLALLAAVALALAGVGLSGAMLHVARGRAREIGICLSLGAREGQVLRQVIVEVAERTVAGIGLGLVASSVVARWMARRLYGVTPYDPLALLGASVVLAVVSALSCYIPARRVARINPLETLRNG
jgi:predicted permease